MCVKAFDDDTISDTETLSLTYLPDRVHWPTMTAADPAKPNQSLIFPLRVRNKMFIHASFNNLTNVIAVVYNTVIVAKSGPCIFLYFSHNLAHFQKFI